MMIKFYDLAIYGKLMKQEIQKIKLKITISHDPYQQKSVSNLGENEEQFDF